MAADERTLKLRSTRERDLLICEGAKAGRDPVVRSCVSGERSDNRVRTGHRHHRIGSKIYRSLVPSDSHDVAERHGADSDADLFRASGHSAIKPECAGAVETPDAYPV